jgi:hypothetical protein
MREKTKKEKNRSWGHKGVFGNFERKMEKELINVI